MNMSPGTLVRHRMYPAEVGLVVSVVDNVTLLWALGGLATFSSNLALLVLERVP